MITIGSKPKHMAENPIGMLQDCHRRIERFLSVLLTVANEGSLAGDRRESFERALRFFRESAPKHTQDEEESLFPRLRNRDANGESVLTELDALHGEHEEADRGHQELETLASRWLEQGELPSQDLQRLRDVLTSLTALYQRHIALEESVVFPAAGRLLSQAEQASLGEEMAARRR